MWIGQMIVLPIYLPIGKKCLRSMHSCRNAKRSNPCRRHGNANSRIRSCAAARSRRKSILLYTTHIYTNTRNDGKTFSHDTKEQAIMAAEQNKEEYTKIASHSSSDIRRCDMCLDEGKTSTALFHKESGKDLCGDHRKTLEALV